MQCKKMQENNNKWEGNDTIHLSDLWVCVPLCSTHVPAGRVCAAAHTQYCADEKSVERNYRTIGKKILLCKTLSSKNGTVLTRTQWHAVSSYERSVTVFWSYTILFSLIFEQIEWYNVNHWFVTDFFFLFVSDFRVCLKDLDFDHFNLFWVNELVFLVVQLNPVQCNKLDFIIFWTSSV